MRMTDRRLRPRRPPFGIPDGGFSFGPVTRGAGFGCALSVFYERLEARSANHEPWLRLIRLTWPGEIMRGLALGDTVSVLLKSLKHSSAEVRRSAAAALESFGAEAEPAIPILMESLSDPDLITQVAA